MITARRAARSGFERPGRFRKVRPDAKVRLWYAQSYSLVRFLIRTQYRSSFYKFSANLRDGRPTPEALYRAYGAPYTRMLALEHAWRYELSRSQMAKIGGQ